MPASDSRANLESMTIERTALPGIGISHAVTTAAHRRLGVISHVSGARDLVVYDPEDPDRAASTITLNRDEAHQLADLLSGTVTVDHLTALEQQLDGVAATRIRIPVGSGYDGVALGDTRTRTRTGASIVAVVRAGEVVPAPGPDFRLRHDDLVVAVGDQHGIAALVALIAGGPLDGG